jgi:hypothetical protein
VNRGDAAIGLSVGVAEAEVADAIEGAADEGVGAAEIADFVPVAVLVSEGSPRGGLCGRWGRSRGSR